jgi:hypothetical protein
MLLPIFDSSNDVTFKTFISNCTIAEKVAFFESLGLRPHSRWLAQLEAERAKEARSDRLRKLH